MHKPTLFTMKYFVQDKSQGQCSIMRSSALIKGKSIAIPGKAHMDSVFADLLSRDFRNDESRNLVFYSILRILYDLKSVLCFLIFLVLAFRKYIESIFWKNFLLFML